MEYKRYRLNDRVINDLKKRSTIGIAFYLIISAVIFLTDNYYQRHVNFAILFLSSLGGVCLFRYLHLFVIKGTLAKFEKADYSVFMISVMLTALLWGLAFTKFMIQDGEYSAKLLMATCTAGLSAGGVVAFIPERRLAIIFNFCMLIPAGCFLLANDTNFAMAIAIMLFSFYLVLITFRGNNEYWDALENESLLLKKSKALEKISQIDGLTGLYNRRYFDEIFDYEWKVSCRARSILTLIICDIDDFKQVNDEHGHMAGDEYLKKTAEILTRVFKRETDIVARFGGEEFVILIPGVDSESIYEIAENFRSQLESSHIEYNGKKIKTTISMGISHCTPELDMQSDLLFTNADRALYMAKQDGRNRIRIL